MPSFFIVIGRLTYTRDHTFPVNNTLSATEFRLLQSKAVEKIKGKGSVHVYLLVKLHLTATECHLPYGITQCYLPTDTSEHTLP